MRKIITAICTFILIINISFSQEENMNDESKSFYQNLFELVQQNKLDEAIILAENEISKYPVSRFHWIKGKNLLHLTENLVQYIDQFYKVASEKMTIKAIYSEMNGFSINPDLWFIDLFGFQEFGGREDFDWLGDFEINAEPSMTITGFEYLQKVFEDKMEKNEWENAERDIELEKVIQICNYLVILRLQELFREAITYAKENNYEWVKIPIFACAHDYNDVIYEVKPKEK